MTTTFIDTKCCPRSRPGPSSGEVAEILNRSLCGAQNVHGALRWLAPGDWLDVAAAPGHHQLLYLMEGEATLTLKGTDYPVGRGSGLYLEPDESARVRQSGGATLKIFHLTVPVLSSAR
jgi:mannose-6-phosphate isomerase-like protein (cupin superfamily)